MQGFPLNLPNKQSYFSKFLSNRGEVNPLENYIEILNLISSDSRVKIKLSHPINLQGTVVDIDTSGIKTDIDNLLWEINKDNPNFIKPKDDKGIDVNGKKIINVGTPTFLSDATNKVYVDNLLDKKQDKLIAGENIKIDEKTNTISATSGKTNLSDYYKKEEIDKKLEDKMDKDQFQYAFSINTIGTEIPNLETTNKTIAGAINEIVKKQPSPIIPQWKYVAFADSKGYEINYELKNNTYYKFFYDNSIMASKPNKYPCLIKEFYWIKSDEVAPMDLLVNIPCMGIGAKFENALLIINKKRIYFQNQKQLNIWKLQELQE